MDTVRTSTAANGNNQVGAARKQSLLDVENSNYQVVHGQLSAADSRERRESGFVEGDFSDYDSSGSRRNSDNFNCYSSDGHSSPDIFCLDLEDGIKKAVVAATATAAAAPNSEAVCKEASKVSSKSSSPASGRRSKKKKKRLCESLSVAHFTDAYTLTGEVLGQGSYGRVETCRHNLTNKTYAVKIISKHALHFSRAKILKEIELYYLCQGQTEIIQMAEYFEEAEDFFLVFEKAEGGILLDHIQQRIRFTESEAASVIRDLAQALAFLHGRGIAHRDLKPENILCMGAVGSGNFLPVKLCDFDLCSAVYQTITTPKLQSPVGSVEYMAPEVVEAFAFDMDIFDYDEDDEDDDLELSYDKRCDLWSLGVIAYILLCGYLPFSGHCGRDCGWADRGEECQVCQHQLFLAIKNGTIHFPEEDWSQVSPQAKDLIKKLLVREASERIEASSVLNHPWIVSGGQSSSTSAPPSTTAATTTNDVCSYEAQDQTLATPAVEQSNQVAAAAPDQQPTPAHVLKRRHKSVHDLFYSMEIMKMQGEQHQQATAHAQQDFSEQRMRKSATVIEFQPTPSVDICRPPPSATEASGNAGCPGNANASRRQQHQHQQRAHANAKMMHRQTSLIVFPEDISPSNIEHSRGRWEF